MAWKRGESGNPSGRAIENRPWRDALRVTLAGLDIEKQKKKLLMLAEKTVELALAGDIQAIREIGNRIDGMPQQQIENVNPTDGISLEEKRAFAGLLADFIRDRRAASGAADTRH